MEIVNKSSAVKRYFNFALPKLLTYETFDESARKCPNVGDLISVSYCDLIPGKTSSAFRVFGCYGLCVARNNSGITTHFTIRNSLKKNSIEFRFFLYSPLLVQIVAFNTKRWRYLRSKLYYLRIKKIAKSRFRVENFRKRRI